MLATLLRDHELSVRAPSPVAVDRPLPGTLDPFGLVFDVRGRVDGELPDGSDHRRGTRP